ncbi:hypothetical protein YC2023_056012 [Brassica napus]
MVSYICHNCHCLNVDSNTSVIRESRCGWSISRGRFWNKVGQYASTSQSCMNTSAVTPDNGLYLNLNVENFD